MAVYETLIFSLTKVHTYLHSGKCFRKKLLFTLQKVSFWNAKSSFSWGEKLLFAYNNDIIYQSATLPMPFNSKATCTPSARNARIIEFKVILLPLSIRQT